MAIASKLSLANKRRNPVNALSFDTGEVVSMVIISRINL